MSLLRCCLRFLVFKVLKKLDGKELQNIIETSVSELRSKVQEYKGKRLKVLYMFLEQIPVRDDCWSLAK